MTKEQLEAIWNGTDIGWLKRQGKTKIKKEPRKLRITFYEKVTKHTIEETVWVGKKDSASTLAYTVLGQHYATYKDYPTTNYETRFVHD